MTLKALLAVSLTQLTPLAYRFCAAPDCPIVYYSVDGQRYFEEAVLRERVYQKHPSDDETLICYCFRHTIGEVRTEIARTGSSTVAARITAGIQAGQCACDIRNPQGTCCLGNVHLLIRRLSSADAGQAH